MVEVRIYLIDTKSFSFNVIFGAETAYHEISTVTNEQNLDVVSKFYIRYVYFKN